MIALSHPARHLCAPHPSDAIRPESPHSGREQAGATAQGGEEGEVVVFAVALHCDSNDMHADAISQRYSLRGFFATTSQRGASCR
jgi:hypothetical protein